MSHYSTAVYYRLLNEGFEQAYGSGDVGEIAIVSLNYGNIERLVFGDRWEDAEAYLSKGIDRLLGARPDVIICASNSMHEAFEPIAEGRRLPYIHIADAAGSSIARRGMTRVALLGTKFTLESARMRRRYLDRWGVNLIAPPPMHAERLHQITLDELCHGVVSPTSRREIEDIAGQLVLGSLVQGIVLGCTELSLLVPDAKLHGVQVFDTTKLHTEAVVDFVKGDPRLVNPTLVRLS